MTKSFCSSAAVAVALFGLAPIHALASSSGDLSFKILDIRKAGKKMANFDVAVTNHSQTKARFVEIECKVKDELGYTLQSAYMHVEDLGSHRSKSANDSVRYSVDDISVITCNAESVKWQH